MTQNSPAYDTLAALPASAALQVELSTIMAQKTGYTDDDLEAAGDDVTLMQVCVSLPQ